MTAALDPLLAAAGLVDPLPAGVGRRGATWQARRRDHLHGQPQAVALKVIALPDDRARRRYQAEVAVVRTLPPDPHLVPVLDAGLAPDGRAWLVTPWMEGGSLGGALEAGGPMPTDVVARAAEDAARGLTTLHRHGVVHANLHPANLLRDAHGEVHLDGMGLPGLEPDGRPSGAPGFVPPEVLEGEPWSTAGDLWALGACLYCLLHGRPPWPALAGEGPAAHLLAIAGGIPRAPGRTGIPPWLSELVEACLAFEPADRPARADEVAHRADTLAPPAAPIEGRPVGSSYLLLEPLGTGSSGQVWRGRRRWDGADVAVKVLRPELSEDPQAVTRFLRERTTLVGLEHPNVVKVLDLVAEGSTLAIVMELVDGADLRRLIRDQQPVPAEQASELLAQVARGLAAVHRAGVVHRDLKPENVLIERPAGAPMRARLTDFGIARAAGGTALTSHDQLLGTAEYLAPELLAGRPLTPAADVYSLGVMGYELFAGRRPFAGEHPATVLRAHLDTPPPPITGLPGPLWDLLSRCLAKEPERRPGAAEVARELDRLSPSLGAQLEGNAPQPERNAAPEPERNGGAAPVAALAAPAGLAPQGPAAAPLAAQETVPEPPTATAAFVSPVRPPVATPSHDEKPPRRVPRWVLVAGAAGLVVAGAVGGLIAALAGGHSQPPTEQTADVTASVAVTGKGAVTVTWANMSNRAGFFAYLLVQDGRPSTTQPSPGSTTLAVDGVPSGPHCFRVAAAFSGRLPSGLPKPNPAKECVSVP